ncbi:MAG: molybdenum cofactor guanylyltransferase [Candidatus Aenigmatarchaeota archaeon]
MEVSCLILAGGKSSRLKNKPFLILKDKPLIKHVFDKLEKIFSDIVVVVKNEDEKRKIEKIVKNCRIAVDKTNTFSPIAGIVEGLKVVKNNFAFIIACDMPFFNEKTVKELFLRFDKNTKCICYAYSLEKFEPLCAIYRKDFFKEASLEDSLSELIRKEKNKVLVPIVKETDEFFNINTEKDFEIAKKLIS